MATYPIPVPPGWDDPSSTVFALSTNSGTEWADEGAVGFSGIVQDSYGHFGPPYEDVLPKPSNIGYLLMGYAGDLFDSHDLLKLAQYGYFEGNLSQDEDACVNITFYQFQP